MAKAFKRKGGEYAGRLDEAERALVVGLMEQVLQLVDPEGATRDTGDVFDDIVAGIGGVGMGVSLSPEDQGEEGLGGTGEGEARPGPERRVVRAHQAGTRHTAATTATRLSGGCSHRAITTTRRPLPNSVG